GGLPMEGGPPGAGFDERDFQNQEFGGFEGEAAKDGEFGEMSEEEMREFDEGDLESEPMEIEREQAPMEMEEDAPMERRNAFER
ncbi:MAG: hypothetical protein ACR2NU_06770, partial [Aeoliella sp.]